MSDAFNPHITSASKKLYMFYIGGSAGQSNIELHDIQFVVGITPESCFTTLKQRWFGTPESLHVDGYRAVTWADGYSITLSDTPMTQTEKLFFVNVGAYSEKTLAELHAFDLFVTPTAQMAKQKALQTLLQGTAQLHKDDLAQVDDCLLLAKVDECFIHLSPDPAGQVDKPLFQGYLPLIDKVR